MTEVRSDIPARLPAYATALRAFVPMKGGLPPDVGRGDLAAFSGTAAKRVIDLWHFVGLLDETARPTPIFRTLMDAHGKAGFKRAFWRIVAKAFAGLSKLDLSTTSVEDLREAMHRLYPRTNIEACMSFFVTAAVRAGTDVSAGLRSCAGRGDRDGGVARSSIASEGPASGATYGGERRASGEERVRDRKPWSPSGALMVLLDDVYDADAMPPGSEAANAVMTMMRALKRL